MRYWGFREGRGKEVLEEMIIVSKTRWELFTTDWLSLSSQDTAFWYLPFDLVVATLLTEAGTLYTTRKIVNCPWDQVLPQDIKHTDSWANGPSFILIKANQQLAVVAPLTLHDYYYFAILYSPCTHVPVDVHLMCHYSKLLPLFLL